MKKILEKLIGVEVDISLKCSEVLCSSVIIAVEGNTLITRFNREINLLEIPHIALVKVVPGRVRPEYILNKIIKKDDKGNKSNKDDDHSDYHD